MGPRLGLPEMPRLTQRWHIGERKPVSDELIGKQVQLRPGHPHAGRVGRIIAVQQLNGDTAVKVQMDGYWGECFAFPGTWREVTDA